MTFTKGDRVYHYRLKRYGTYLGRHDRCVTETSSYVRFDGDPEGSDGPVSTALLDSEARAVALLTHRATYGITDR
jgi:hypothetical protein